MTEQWREAFLAWAETPQYAVSMAAATISITAALDRHARPYIAYSGGKDSTVLLHLVLQQAPETMVYHWDFGPYKLPRPIETELLGNARAIGANSLRVETSPTYERYGRNASHVFEQEFFGRAVHELAHEGYDCAFVGLRKQEGIGRRLRIDAHHSIGPIPESWPLADWCWRDVWAHVVSNNIPYLKTYDTEAELLGWDRARFSSFFDADLYHLGTEQVDNVLHWRHRNA